MIITAKFDIGDRVYYARTNWASTPATCVACSGRGRIQATHAFGSTDITCPKCGGKGNDGAYSHAPFVSKVTIGSVCYDSARKHHDKFTYMCKETGVGSGTIYNESCLFASENEAKVVASLLATKAQKDWERTHEKDEHGNWREVRRAS